jgi:DNA-binding transcriptional regulator YdaS (Cro superfamily)
MNTINKVRIKVGSRSKIAKMFGVSVTTVSLAASGVTKSKLAEQIRAACVNAGGDPIYEKSINQ